MHECQYLIIGVGNTLRSDDGAGMWLAEAVAEGLAERGKAVEVRLLQQLLPELAEEIAELGPQIVVIADCSAEGGETPLEQVSRLMPATGGDGEDGSVGARDDGWGAQVGSHGLGAAALVELARRLYGFGGEAWLATVPGVDFGHGEGLSGATRQAIDDLAPTVVARIL